MLQDLPLTLSTESPPEAVARLIAEADRRVDDFFADGLGRRYPRYLPSDPAKVHAALASLLRGGALRGEVFCEWGCGFGVATGIAALLGFDAVGIEIETELARRATSLLEDLDIPAEILPISYLPDGFEVGEGVGGADLIPPLATTAPGQALVSPLYDGLDPAEVDLFFVYPWPGQEQLMMDLFEAVATDGAVLLMYLADGDVEAYLID